MSQIPRRPDQYPVIIQQQKTNGLAVASLVLSLLFFLILPSILAVIFGHVAIGQINRSNGLQTGKGMAIAGTIIGWLGVAYFVVVFANIASSGSY